MLATNQKDLRMIFWQQFPEFTRKGNQTQNKYPADVRMSWVDWVDGLSRDGSISESLARRALL